MRRFLKTIFVINYRFGVVRKSFQSVLPFLLGRKFEIQSFFVTLVNVYINKPFFFLAIHNLPLVIFNHRNQIIKATNSNNASV